MQTSDALYLFNLYSFLFIIIIFLQGGPEFQ